jgi:hypothetical protein
MQRFGRKVWCGLPAFESSAVRIFDPWRAFWIETAEISHRQINPISGVVEYYIHFEECEMHRIIFPHTFSKHHGG